jgi:ComF family protein
MLTMISGLVKEISYVLFPRKCSYCGLLSEAYLCDSCKFFLKTYEPECYVTRQQSDNWKTKVEHQPLEKVYYFYRYNTPIHNLMISIKYLFHYDKISDVMRLITSAEEFRKLDFKEIELITCVPISKRRESWRGFNQSKLLAKGLAEYLQIPYCTLLEKIRYTRPQIELERVDRLKNVSGTFRPLMNIPVVLDQQSILIIDDVCTTGSTLIACANALKNKYPKLKIYGLCLARGDD